MQRRTNFQENPALQIEGNTGWVVTEGIGRVAFAFRRAGRKGGTT